MISDRFPGIHDLSSQEKRDLASELWDDAGEGHSDPAFDAAVAELLERRHERYLENPDEVVSWEGIRSRLASE